MNAYLRKKKERKNNIIKAPSPSAAAAAAGGGCPYTVEPGQIPKNKSPSAATTFKQLFYFCFLPTNTTKNKTYSNNELLYTRRKRHVRRL
jgi:hypothetical protein